MLAINDSAANHLDLRGAYFDGSLELLRELAVTIDLDTALPRLSAIATKMLPHDVRELRNVLERAAILCEGALIAASPSDSEAPARGSCNGVIALQHRHARM
jgi:transcriptional regulator of acetoin/glycerol metabolism